MDCGLLNTLTCTMGVDGVENKMGSYCGIWKPTPEFSNGKTNAITMGWFGVMLVVDGSRSAGGGYPIQKLRTPNNILKLSCIDFKNEMLIKGTALYNILKSGISTITKHKSSGPDLIMY